MLLAHSLCDPRGQDCTKHNVTQCLKRARAKGFFEQRYASQNGEDGVAESIFDCFGPIDKYYVEFGAEMGTQVCNSRYFREKHGFTGLLMDGGFDVPSINLHREMIFEENLRALLKKYNVPRRFDFLSIDVDANTFWLLRELLLDYRPRLIVTEINAIFLPFQSYTTLYNPYHYHTGCYFGASVAAFSALGRSFNYTPIYLESTGTNLFMIDSELLDEPWDLPDIAPETHFKPPSTEFCHFSTWLHVPTHTDFRSAYYKQALVPVTLVHANHNGTMRLAEFTTDIDMTAVICKVPDMPYDCAHNSTACSRFRTWRTGDVQGFPSAAVRRHCKRRW